MAVAGSISVTQSDAGNGYTKYTIVWTSDAGGNVSGNDVAVRRGFLTRVRFRPASGGTQPTDLYDVTVTDDFGVDVLNGAGANLSNVNASAIAPSPRLYIESGNLTPVVSNAGNAKSGTIELLTGP